MAKITLNDVTAGRTDVNVLNANAAAIETFSDTCLTLDGTAPNAMAASLDLGNNRLINLADPVDAQDSVTKTYFETNYTDQVATNTAGIATNVTDIATNVTNISTNATNIANLQVGVISTYYTHIGTGALTVTPGANVHTFVGMTGDGDLDLTIPTAGTYIDGETYTVQNDSASSAASVSFDTRTPVGGGGTRYNISASAGANNSNNWIKATYILAEDNFVVIGSGYSTAP